MIVHVVCDEATLNGTAANAGCMDGHGVITDHHVRDLAARPDAVIRPMRPRTPARLASDAYRPSSALDTHVRIDNAYCVEPGCDRSAFECDLDHVAEYDRSDPERGGQTAPDGLNAKCRAGHLLKTFGDWLDDQYRDADGRLVIEFTTPEGLSIPGPAETNEDLFPPPSAALRRVLMAGGRQDDKVVRESGDSRPEDVPRLISNCWGSISGLARHLFVHGTATQTDIDRALFLPEHEPEARAFALASIRSGSAPGSFKVTPAALL